MPVLRSSDSKQGEATKQGAAALSGVPMDMARGVDMAHWVVGRPERHVVDDTCP